MAILGAFSCLKKKSYPAPFDGLKISLENIEYYWNYFEFHLSNAIYAWSNFIQLYVYLPYLGPGSAGLYKIGEKSDDFCNIGSDCLLLKQHIGDNFFVMNLGFLDINRFVIFQCSRWIFHYVY